MALRLTEPLLEAMDHALSAALAGEGFDGGDFDGCDPEHFERARTWIAQERVRRAKLPSLSGTGVQKGVSRPRKEP